MTRPLEITSMVANVCASSTGLRSAGSIGTMPRRILLVRAAKAAIVVRQSPRALSSTVTLSPSHRWSKPNSSACAASRQRSAKLLTASSARISWRVCSSKPICTLLTSYLQRPFPAQLAQFFVDFAGEAEVEDLLAGYVFLNVEHALGDFDIGFLRLDVLGTLSSHHLHRGVVVGAAHIVRGLIIFLAQRQRLVLIAFDELAPLHGGAQKTAHQVRPLDHRLLRDRQTGIEHCDFLADIGDFVNLKAARLHAQRISEAQDSGVHVFCRQ